MVGHSRTVIGSEVRKGVVSLLILDPSHDSSTILRACMVEKENLRVLRRQRSHFVKEHYQIVCVENDTPLNTNEYERSKVLMRSLPDSIFQST